MKFSLSTLGLALLALVIITLSACSGMANREPTSPKKPRPASGRYTMKDDAPPLPGDIPPDVANTPDAVPKAEPLSRSGNSPVYTVLGGTYEVLQSADNFRQSGGASWYGRKFHGNKTASGERYDMFSMSAAHKTLPLPTYVRVTRVDTGKSIVVKVNDRGPFHSNRIIDLSYAAAAKLDMIKHGAVQVEIEAITPDREFKPVPPSTLSTSLVASSTEVKPVEVKPVTVQRGWLQIAAYSDPINALALREDLNHAGLAPVEIWSGGRETTLHRVLIGPFPNLIASQAVREKILARGLAADWVNE